MTFPWQEIDTRARDLGDDGKKAVASRAKSIGYDLSRFKGKALTAHQVALYVVSAEMAKETPEMRVHKMLHTNFAAAVVIVGPWMAEMCRYSPGSSESGYDLHASFRRHCGMRGVTRENMILEDHFRKYLTALGFPPRLDFYKSESGKRLDTTFRDGIRMPWWEPRVKEHRSILEDEAKYLEQPDYSSHYEQVS